MQWRCRQEVEDALWRAAREQLGPRSLERKRILQAIRERTALYTTERSSLAGTVGREQSEVDLAARALFFTVADAAKIHIPLSELMSRGALPAGERWRVLDVGAGAGAMGLGILSFAADHHPGLALDIEAIDLDEGALSIYARAVEILSASPELGASTIRTRAASAIGGLKDAGEHDLVVLGSVLNELASSERVGLVRRCLAALRPGGSVIVIEPALRETSRGLHALRDALVDEAHVFAPCTRRLQGCPALEDARDWCHEDRAFVLPDLARQMALATGLRDSGLKFSYLVLRAERVDLFEGDPERMALRVVSQPQRGKGQRECFACGPEGRTRLRLLKRNRSSSNRVFERARRGDLLVSTAKTWGREERTDIEKSDPIELVRPAEKD